MNQEDMEMFSHSQEQENVVARLAEFVLTTPCGPPEKPHVDTKVVDGHIEHLLKSKEEIRARIKRLLKDCDIQKVELDDKDLIISIANLYEQVRIDPTNPEHRSLFEERGGIIHALTVEELYEYLSTPGFQMYVALDPVSQKVLAMVNLFTPECQSVPNSPLLKDTIFDPGYARNLLENNQWIRKKLDTTAWILDVISSPTKEGTGKGIKLLRIVIELLHRLEIVEIKRALSEIVRLQTTDRFGEIKFYDNKSSHMGLRNAIDVTALCDGRKNELKDVTIYYDLHYLDLDRIIEKAS